MLEIVLAAALMASDAPVKPVWLEVLRPTILTLAIDGELVDPRECAFLLKHDFAGDLAILRTRYDEFKNCPKLDECNRWPDRKLINDLLSMNRFCRNIFTKRLELDLLYEDALKDAIGDCDRLYQVWDTVRDAQCDYYYVTVRRNALKLLRDLIGDEAFYNGQMPPNVPVWHLPRR